MNGGAGLSEHALNHFRGEPHSRRVVENLPITPTSVPVPNPPALSVAVIVKLPVFVMVTLWEANTPLVNVAVAPPPADSVPVELMSTVLPAPSNGVTVLLLASSAVIWMLKAVPAVCVPMAPPPAASTTK